MFQTANQLFYLAWPSNKGIYGQNYSRLDKNVRGFSLILPAPGRGIWCLRAEHVRGHEFALRNSLIIADIDFSIDLTLIAIGKSCWISMWVGLCYVIYFGHLHGHQWVASRNPKKYGQTMVWVLVVVHGCTMKERNIVGTCGHQFAYNFHPRAAPSEGTIWKLPTRQKTQTQNGDVICIVLCIKKMYFHHPKPGSAALMVSPMREPWFTYEMWSLDVRAWHEFHALSLWLFSSLRLPNPKISQP